LPGRLLLARVVSGLTLAHSNNQVVIISLTSYKISMTRHVDLDWTVGRTPPELRNIGYNLDEINVVIDGYPELNDRLFVEQHERIPMHFATLLGAEVSIYELPPGYDATDSSERQNTLQHMTAGELLLGEPDPDLPTGGDWCLQEDHPTVIRALRQKCREFTQHKQPLLPGWRQLLALRDRQGRQLGMPTGIGWFTHLGLSDMCDAVTYRLSEDSQDIEGLFWDRPDSNQSEHVAATAGGFVIKSDTQRPDMTPLQAASARRTMERTGRDVSAYAGVPLQVKYPISSGTTLVAGLRTTPYGRFIHNPDYGREPSMTSMQDERFYTPQGWAAGYVSMRAILDSNPTGGVSGKQHEGFAFPMWTTHFEYAAAGLDALMDPENRFRFGMSSRQFYQVNQIINDYYAAYPALQMV